MEKRAQRRQARPRRAESSTYHAISRRYLSAYASEMARR